ncbi:MAG: hypothetical protein U0R80_15240 [Nocardioidaceae bacterium]
MERSPASDWESTAVVTKKGQSGVVRVTAVREAIRGLAVAAIWALPTLIAMATAQPAVATVGAVLVLVVVASHARNHVRGIRLMYPTGQTITSTIRDGFWWLRWVSPVEDERRVGLMNYVRAEDGRHVVDLMLPTGNRGWWPRELLGDDGLAVVREHVGRPRAVDPLVAGAPSREWAVSASMLRRCAVAGWAGLPTGAISVTFLVAAVAAGVWSGEPLAWLPVLSPVVWWLRDLRGRYRGMRWAWQNGAVIRTSIVGGDLVEEGPWVWQATPLTEWDRPRRIGGVWVLAARHGHGSPNVLPEVALSEEMVEAIRRSSGR